MFKAIRVTFLVGVMLIVLSGGAVAYYDESVKEVELTYEGGYSNTYTTDATDVEDFLKERSIPYEDYEVSQELNSLLKNDMKIILTKKHKASLMVDGKPVEFETKAGTVEETVKRYSDTTGMDYEYDETIGKDDIKSHSGLVLVSYNSKEFEKTEAIPFEIERIETEEIDVGIEKVITEGEEGSRDVRVLVEYRAGEEVGKTVLEEKITKEPVKKVIHVGIGKSVKVNDTNIKYTKELNMNATAYTANYACTGKSPGDRGFGVTASGMQARYGVVAVDPKVIPLGTKLYIEGYGEAVAGDTGGAINGNKIDLYLNTYDECLNFGRQQVKVYVLDK